MSFVLAPVLGAAALVQTISVAMLVNNLTKINVFRKGIDWSTCALVVACAAPGCVVGSLFYSSLDERAITILLGAFLVGIVIVKWMMPEETGVWSKPAIAGMSFVYGVLSGSTVGSGIILLPIMRGSGLAGMPLIGTDAAAGFAMHIVKTGVFSQTGVLTQQYVVIGILIGLVMIPGAYIARWLLQRMPVKVHERIMDAVVIGGGVSFLARALWT